MVSVLSRTVGKQWDDRGSACSHYQQPQAYSTQHQLLPSVLGH